MDVHLNMVVMASEETDTLWIKSNLHFSWVWMFSTRLKPDLLKQTAGYGDYTYTRCHIGFFVWIAPMLEQSGCQCIDHLFLLCALVYESVAFEYRAPQLMQKHEIR